MEQTFRAQRRDTTGRFGLVRLWTETIAGLLRTAPREHLSQLRQDSAYALRVMRRSPTFTTVSVLTLAVGIGATTAIFSIVNTVLLKPLPYRAPDRLVRIYERNVSDNLLHNSASAPNVVDWQQQTTAFGQIAAYRTRAANVSGRGDPRVVQAARASVNFFAVLGIQPALGRTISEAEDRQGAPVVVISDALWRSQFGRDPSAIGRPLEVDGVSYTVIGVLPRDFEFGADAALWMPLRMYSGIRSSRGAHSLSVVARLADDATIAQAQSDLLRVSAALSNAYPNTNTGWDAVVEPLRTSLVRDVRAITLLLLGAVTFVLLITCANISSLLVARASGRVREFAVRAALGASRSRIVRQLVTEGVIMSAAGGTAGAARTVPPDKCGNSFSPFDVAARRTLATAQQHPGSGHASTVQPARRGRPRRLS
jgi:putative ABC transport system permease protein